MRTQGFILVRAKMSLRQVDVAAAHVALHQSARSRGYKNSRGGADPKSLWWCVSLSACPVSCVSFRGPPRCGPCLPFYSSQGEGSGYNCGKKVKGKKMKEKNKMVASGVAVFLLIRHEQLTLQHRDAMGVKLLTSLSTSATRCGHALTCVLLHHRGWVVRAPGFA
jgi:hypothetical protein